MSDDARAAALFESFQHRPPNRGELVELGDAPKVTALAVGTVVEIGYRAIGNGKQYRHYFESPLPRLFVSADGRQVYFVGGGYRFSDRGFLR